jgi:hypothetical protein
MLCREYFEKSEAGGGEMRSVVSALMGVSLTP